MSDNTTKCIFRLLDIKVEIMSVYYPPKLPDSEVMPQLTSDKCQRCVVMGNGGILKGLELGPLIDRFDIIIRLDLKTHFYNCNNPICTAVTTSNEA